MPATQTRPQTRPKRPSSSDGGDFALAQLSDGRLIVGTAPFTRSATPSPDGVSFYSNDFSLSDPKPWRIPSAWDELGSTTELKAAKGAKLPALKWQAPERAGFEAAFAEIRTALDSGDLVKAVPAVTAQAKISKRSNPAPALVAAAKDPGRSSWLYAFKEGDRGFVGLTPERLFRMDARKLWTMALAGTAEPDKGEAFAKDAKEQQEHLLVVEALRRRLAAFGDVSEGEREILDVGGMIHFLTRFDVKLGAKPEIDDVIAALHPTPAVGAVPRSEESLKKLAALREGLGVPRAFGAPFGVKLGQRFEAFVAIRGVFWEGSQAFLPSGCGVVTESVLEREWEELELKRNWVETAFGLG